MDAVKHLINVGAYRDAAHIRPAQRISSTAFRAVFSVRSIQQTFQIAVPQGLSLPCFVQFLGDRMKSGRALWMSLALTTVSIHAYAQTSTALDPYEEYGKHLRAAQEVTPLTSNLFGDQVSLYNGSTEFDVTDVDLPGNSNLPVRFGRRLTIDDRRQPTGQIAGLGDWDIEIPYIDGVFATENGWQVQSGSGESTSRCSIVAPPYTVVGNINEPTYSIWDGNQLHIPGEVSEELLKNTEAKLPAVSDGKTYPWLTKSLYRATCGTTHSNSFTGESFIVVTPSGVRYTFDWATSNPTSQMSYQVANPAGSGTVKGVANRTRMFLLATEVDDRFGNWVKYGYNSASQLTQISANDGRLITIGWSGNSVATVTTGARTWQYGYAADGSLHTVTRPDGSTWTYTIQSGSLATVKAPPDNEKPPSYHCQIDPNPNTGSFVYAIGSPSGAQGIFSFTYQRNSRKYVPQSCTDSNPNTVYPLVYDFFDNFALVSKQIIGAGLTTQNWSYNYGSNTLGYVTASVPYPTSGETYIPQSSTAYFAPKVVTVTSPTEVSKYSFGVNYGVDEGRLYKTETDSLSGTVMRAVTNSYVADSTIASQNFPDNAGQSVQPIWKNPMVARLRP